MLLRASVFVAIVLLLPLFTFAASCPNLTRTLSLGSRGQDVVALQNFLIAQGDLAAGNNTGYYGKLTETAVKKFQCRTNVVCSGSPSTTGYGTVGKKTRTAIMSACAGVTSQNSGQQTSTAQTMPPLNLPFSRSSCTPVELPTGKLCNGTWKEVKDTKGCTTSWQCQ